jgi:ABC-type uncharacterized transport system substrate-binding protein
VGVGLVASFARPGGNITGTSQQAPDIFAKRLQLLAQALPQVSTVAVVWNAANPANARSWREVQDAARVLRIHLQSREVRGPADFERVLAEMARDRPDALLLIGDRLTLQHGAEIVEFATQKRIPSMLDRAYLETVGALMSYGAEEEELWRRAADLADKILRGAKPADLPIEQPTKFKLVINLKTAKPQWVERGKKWSGRLDLNQRPQDPQSCALPGCATPRPPSVILPESQRRFKDSAGCGARSGDRARGEGCWRRRPP